MKEFEITVKVKCDNLVKAKYCLKQMLNGLDKQQIWYSNLYNIKEVIESKHVCCFCNKRLDIDQNGNKKHWIYGNNAQPVFDGRCCDKCNLDVVIPQRFY